MTVNNRWLGQLIFWQTSTENCLEKLNAMNRILAVKRKSQDAVGSSPITHPRLFGV